MIGSITQVQQEMAAAEKRRKARKDHAALTPAHTADEAFVEAGCGPEGHCDAAPMGAGDARKAAIRGLEAKRGPGTSMEPGKIGPEDFQRPYVEAGHAARSPLAAPPRVSPLPPEGAFTRGTRVAHANTGPLG
jgi:hypothetical protein